MFTKEKHTECICASNVTAVHIQRRTENFPIRFYERITLTVDYENLSRYRTPVSDSVRVLKLEKMIEKRKENIGVTLTCKQTYNAYSLYKVISVQFATGSSCMIYNM